MAEIKYTLLPPQKVPMSLTAYRRPASLGEHQAAFLNATNRYGFQVDEIPEEPIVDEMAGLFLTILYNMPKLSRSERKRESAQHYRKMVKAGFMFRNGVWVKQEPKPAKVATPKPTPLQEYEKALKDPRWQQPWNHAAYHEGIRKHIVATRTHFSYQAVPLGPLRDDEYRSRLDKLLGELEQQSNIKNPALRKLVTMEKAERILQEQASQFTTTINIDEFMGPIEPKSEPTGRHRINPYL